MTHKIYINAYFIISLHFSYPVNQVYLVMTFRRPSRSSNLVPRLAVVGVVLPLSSRTAAAGKQKNTLIMIMQDPAEGVEPSQRAVPGAGWGRVLECLTEAREQCIKS